MTPTTNLLRFLLGWLLSLLLTVVESAPQYDAFIRTNMSRIHSPRSIHHMNDRPHMDSHHSGAHGRHTKDTIITTTGALKGLRRTTPSGKEVHVYYGVPFAQPPLNHLRFKKPVPVEPWNGTFNAFHQPNTCFQEIFKVFEGFRGEVTWLPNTPIDEDCLYMNIWVPKPNKRHGNQRNEKKMSILVWIYGGGYVSGTATLDIYNADILAAENNVIVVVPQYRVGAFGFLYFGHKDAPGNVGLFDQAVAIQWIKDNAEKFGGDPNSITIFGESAGGGSVTFHLLSPITRHLIDRGIIQSGTINAPWSIMKAERAKEIAEKLTDDCNCTGTADRKFNVEEKIECLRKLPASVVSQKQWESYAKILQFFSAPTIDGEFLPKDPMDMLMEGDFKKVPLLIGSNKDEGTYFILYDYIENFTKEGENCQPRELFLDTVESVFGHLSLAQKEAIRFQYTHWEDIQDPCRNRDKFIEFVGDYYFICPTNRFAETYAKQGADVYYYFFTQRTSTNPWGEWMGVMHADEIEYVFGIPLNGTKQHTPQEEELSRRIMKYFTVFAETGARTLLSTHPAEVDPDRESDLLDLSTSSTLTSSTIITRDHSLGSVGGANSVTSSSPANSPNYWWVPVSKDSDEYWPLYNREQPVYFILNADPAKKGTGRGPRANTCAFWNEFMPVIAPVPGTCNTITDSAVKSFSSSSLLMGITTILNIIYWNHINK